MQTVGQIIRLRRESLGMTLASLAQSAGATKSYLSMVENHRVANPPSRRLIQRLEAALKIEDGGLLRAADWQRTPSDVRARVQQLAESAQRGRALANWIKQTTQPRRDGGRSLDDLYRSGDLAKRVNEALATEVDDQSPSLAASPARFQVPLINHVAAGYPSDFTDLEYPARVADEYVPCPEIDDPHAFAARVCGDSMLPDYRDGDIVIFSPAAEVTDGCDCFLRLAPDHETTFKRVFFQTDDNQVRLQPLNFQFPATIVDRTQITGMYRAVWRFQPL